MKKRNTTAFFFYLLSAPIIGGLSALITGSYSDFFITHEQPPLLPPGWLFPVVWTVLYLLMGYSAYLVSVTKADEDEKKRALKIYWIQLIVNFSWSIVFFKFSLLWWGVAVIALLLILIALMLYNFSKINKTSAYLNIPYLLWVIFATYLTVATAIVNYS